MKDNLEHRINDGEKEIVERLKRLSVEIPTHIDDEHVIRAGKYIVDHNITILDKGRLIIEEGTEIMFDKSKGIICGIYAPISNEERPGGQLIIEGTKDRPVILGAQVATWDGISFVQTKEESIIRHAHIIHSSSSGINCRHGKFQMENCVIDGCDTYSNGGGIFIEYSTARLVDTIIKNNIAEKGGGIYSTESKVRIENSMISHNHARNTGGGIYINESRVTIENSTINHNNAQKMGGGIYNDARSRTILSNSNLKSNQAGEYGGGIYNNSDSEMKLVDSRITWNHAGREGGGIFETVNSSWMKSGFNISHCRIRFNSPDNRRHI